MTNGKRNEEEPSGKKKNDCIFIGVYYMHNTQYFDKRERILPVHIYVYIHVYMQCTIIFVCINTVYVYQSVHDTNFSV